MGDWPVIVVRAGEAQITQYEGSTERLLLGPDRGSPDLVVRTYSCDPGFTTGIHRHTADSVAVITSGTAVFAWGIELENEMELTVGDWLYIGKDVPHEERTPSDVGVEMIVVLNDGGGTSITDPQTERTHRRSDRKRAGVTISVPARLRTELHDVDIRPVRFVRERS